MSKQLSILLIEPSDIIANGIEFLLTKLRITGDFHRCKNLPEMDKDYCGHHLDWDIVIINPVLMNMCPHVKKSLHHKFHDSTLIALITSVYDRNFCDMFQDCIYLNDDESKVYAVLHKYIKTKHNPLTDSSILTEREIEVLRYLVQGNSIKEIADSLNISNHTALSHRRNISDKLGIKSVAAMAIYAVAAKIIDPNESLDALK